MHIRRLRGWLMWLFGLFDRGRREREFAEELESHLALHIEDNIRAGMSPEEARRQAQIKLGGMTQVQELHREQRGLPMLETLIQDLRFGLRTLRKHTGVTALIALSLMLGIAANTTIFSVVNALLIAPPPVERPNELWQVWLSNLQSSSAMKRYRTMTYPSLQFLREHQQSFQSLAAMKLEPQTVTWNYDGTGVAAQCQTVTGNYFEVCGVRAALGRTFAPDEDRTAGAHPVALVSHEFWRQKLGARPDVIGQSITINGAALTIIGVAPPRFTGAVGVVAPELWIPFAMAPTVFREPELLTNHGRYASIGLGRLKSGVTTAQAEADLNSLMRRLAESQPNLYENQRIGLQPSLAVPAHARGMIAGFTSILMAAVFFVLLIACANAANLLLARAATRRAEMAVRAALGASRGRLIRQLLTESVMIAGLGGSGGVLLTTFIAPLLVRLIPEEIPMRLTLVMDWRVYTFAAVVSLATGLIFGLAPAWRSAQFDLTTMLNAGGRKASARNSWWSRALVVAQMAVCLILLIAGTLCLRSLMKAQELDLGFQPAGRALVRVDLSDFGYQEAEQQAFYARWLERAAALPGVQSVSLAHRLPLGTGSSSMAVSPAERTLSPEENRTTINVFRVAPGYFATMGTALLQGREFNQHDRIGAPLVAILNETAAARYWPGENPIGRRLAISNRETAEVVGLVANGKYLSLSEEPTPVLFLNFLQRPAAEFTLVAHVAGDAQVTLAAIRQMTKEIDPRLALTQMATLRDYLKLALFPMRTSALLLGILGGVALLLATSGLFGVIAYSVAQRTHEVGIRLALGAQQGQIVRQIIREGMLLAGCGIALGLSGAFALTRLMQSMLFNVSATDPLSFLGIALLLGAVALLACGLPARRAAKVDPLVALRHE
jgi:putative ABC transport system permease protein